MGAVETGLEVMGEAEVGLLVMGAAVGEVDDGDDFGR